MTLGQSWHSQIKRTIRIVYVIYCSGNWWYVGTCEEKNFAYRIDEEMNGEHATIGKFPQAMWLNDKNPEWYLKVRTLENVTYEEIKMVEQQVRLDIIKTFNIPQERVYAK